MQRIHQTAADQVAVELRRRILTGELPVGAHLRQEAVAEMFGLSRIPVREALQRLDAEGWVTFAPHRGAFVSGLSATEVTELFELRLLLEPHLLARAVPCFDAPALQTLEAAADAFEAALDRTDRHGWGAANRLFHQQLYLPAVRPRIMALTQSFDERVEAYVGAHLALAGIAPRAVTEHRQLVEAVRDRDGERAVHVLREHLERTRDELTGWIARGGDTS
ncbi:MAG TPA: GntR family transcriptional regulator [Geminicoccus sp.]|jgi:DNA-binding GntR family transcriptional regulator|uniref:GntR family transcriptional regulator n=1 Tax=Geminicoccus sp. TaxID=2024832 RepID=UPI002E34411B|nr:GntR family transcriptional regulator [Geminicoccus sp.]HEX2525503.1 GntR family transcriptional regulator [Geminicoccus sp.]